jgi:hypothetical protein
MTFIVAAAAGAVLGAAAFPYRRYRFWWKWSRPIFGLALVALLAINAGFAILGIEIAHGMSWEPWDEAWRNGLSYAVLGLAIVRVRLPGIDIEGPPSSTHALEVIMRWVVGWLDDFAAETIRRTLARLPHEQLRELTAYVLNAEVIPDNSLDSQDRAAETTKMAQADASMQQGDGAAWAQMLAWCVLQTRRRLLVIDRLR